eukprot:XP_001709463.1 Hypothetical protein GL50803_115756 [Giardia lamblia ATCC 50803]
MLGHFITQGPPDASCDGLDVAQSVACASLQGPYTAGGGRVSCVLRRLDHRSSGSTIH